MPQSPPYQFRDENWSRITDDGRLTEPGGYADAALLLENQPNVSTSISELLNINEAAEFLAISASGMRRLQHGRLSRSSKSEEASASPRTISCPIWQGNGWDQSANNDDMAVRTDRKTWWVDFRFNHTRYRKRSPENSKAGAQAYEAVLRNKLARGEDIEGSAKPHLAEQSFGQFAGDWFSEYVLPNNKYSEQKAKRHILSSSLVPFFGKMPVGQITTHHIEQYKARQIKLGVSNKTINNRLTVLNKCLVTAYDWLQIETALPKAKKLKCPPGETDHLSQEEASLLLSHADGILYELLLTTLRTGMRQGELKGLQWEAVNWESGTVKINRSWNDELRELEAPKSNRERLIPLDAEVASILWERKKRCGFVFLDADGMPFTEQRLNPRLERLCKKAGLRRITWHTLRHTFATHLMMKGAAVNTVQTLLGHATIATTMRYAHVPSSSLREAICLLSVNRGALGEFGQPVVSARR